MTEKSKRIFTYIFLILATAWNCLCLLGVLPLEKWTVSFVLCALGWMPLLTPPRKKQGLAPFITLTAAWFISALACIVLPL